jgi:FAD/FMN-containing dehydrogenase
MAVASTTEWLGEIAHILPRDRISTQVADLDAASHDESSLAPVRPDAVVWPLSTEEASAVVTIAARHAVPLTARGAASSSTSAA